MRTTKRCLMLLEMSSPTNCKKCEKRKRLIRSAIVYNKVVSTNHDILVHKRHNTILLYMYSFLYLTCQMENVREQAEDASFFTEGNFSAACCAVLPGGLQNYVQKQA